MADKERDIITSEGGSQGGAAIKRNAFFGKDVWMCIVVLAAIALVAGVLLGLVNWLTYVDPDQVIREQLAGYYGVGTDEVVALPDAVTEGSSYVAAAYVVNTAEGAVAVYHSVGSGAKGGTLELLVHIGEDGVITDIEVYVGEDGVITDIEVYAQSETAGYMDRVISANNMWAKTSLKRASSTLSRGRAPLQTRVTSMRCRRRRSLRGDSTTPSTRRWRPSSPMLPRR